MSNVTRDGRDWQPAYLLAIDEKKCIGFGRCYKVCGREVMTLKGLNEDGELVALDDDEDDEVEPLHINSDNATNLSESQLDFLTDNLVMCTKRAARSLKKKKKNVSKDE